LTIGFIVVASLVFAAVAVSRQGLWAFPIVVSLWTAFLWMLIGRGVAAFSKPPHRPGRVAAIVIGCSIAALIVLAVTVFIGLLFVGPNSANL
jgi:CHASE2 domain-containing sensor protein